MKQKIVSLNPVSPLIVGLNIFFNFEYNLVKNLSLPLLSAILFSLLVNTAEAKIFVSERVKYFSVTGKTGKQIFAQIKQRAPAHLRKNHWIAATFAQYNFKKVEFGVRGKRCVATKVDFRLNLTYYYPKWKNRKSGSKKLRKQWDIFAKELVRHEKIHGNIFREMLHDIERELRRTSSRASDGCKRHIGMLKRKIAAITKRYDIKQDLFDKKENRSTSRVSKIERTFIKTK